MDDKRLENKVVVVTGGAQGIGRAVVQLSLARGAKVTFFDLQSEAGEETVQELRATGDVTFIGADITDEAAVEQATGEVVRRWGRVDVLVNNAGRNSYAHPVRMSAREWDEVFAVDLKGAWLCSKHALPSMVANERGSIINIASLHARLTARGMFPYAAAKSGLVGLTRSLALEVGPNGIRVNSVSPGYVKTALVDEYFQRHDDSQIEQRILDVHPLGRIGRVGEIAEVVCFLASDAASFVTGADWAVDGGLGARFA